VRQALERYLDEPSTRWRVVDRHADSVARPRDYNAAVRVEPRNIALGMLLVLLVAVFYPALVLGRRVAPEVALKGVPPWRQEWGPNPEPPLRVLAAATELGPRLAIIAREGFGAALWDPWIGGGRPGWLSSAREGGAPLPVAAALLARPPWVWSALLVLTIAASFAGTWFAARWSGASAWGAAVAALAYSLAGPVSSHWLDWRGSAQSLGPLAVLPALAGGSSWRRRTVAWAAAIAVLLLCGSPAMPFLAVAVALELAGRKADRLRNRLLVLGCAAVLAICVRLPVAWLDHFGGEAGATSAAVPAPALPGLRALVVPDASDRRDLGAGSPAGLGAEALPEVGFLGVSTIVLACAGFLALRSRQRWFWAAVAVASLALALAPPAWPGATALMQRPLGVLALAAALLAGAGTDWLCRRLPGRAGHAAGAAVAAVLLVELAPVALHGLPYASEEELQLQAPLPPDLLGYGSRVFTMVSALPPDVAAAFDLADVRARWFTREPAYEAMLRSATSRAAQSLDVVVAQLGGRWVLEPYPLRLVSGIAFGDVDVIEAERASPQTSTSARYRITLPVTAGRVGVPRGRADGAVLFLQGDGGTAALEADHALAEESAEWSWFGVPAGAPRGEVVLGVIGDHDGAPSLPLALDTSGLRLVSDGAGLRVWEWAHARPFAALDDATAKATVTVNAVSPARVEVKVETPVAGRLVVQVKHRPELWRAAVDGSPAATTLAERVWTGVPVPAGTSRVVLAASIPARVWLVALLAVVIICLIGLPWRER